jgi:hypothetical protein
LRKVKYFERGLLRAFPAQGEGEVDAKGDAAAATAVAADPAAARARLAALREDLLYVKHFPKVGGDLLASAPSMHAWQRA